MKTAIKATVVTSLFFFALNRAFGDIYHQHAPGVSISELAQALAGQVREHHRFLLQTHLEHLEFLEQQIGQFDQRIEQLIEFQSTPEETSTLADPATVESLSWQQAMTLLDTIPGVARQSAGLLLAEIGIDMNRFPSAAHLCSGAGVVPGNHEMANSILVKRRLATAGCAARRVQMANAAVRCKNRFISLPFIAGLLHEEGTNEPF